MLFAANNSTQNNHQIIYKSTTGDAAAKKLFANRPGPHSVRLLRVLAVIAVSVALVATSGCVGRSKRGSGSNEGPTEASVRVQKQWECEAAKDGDRRWSCVEKGKTALLTEPSDESPTETDQDKAPAQQAPLERSVDEDSAQSVEKPAEDKQQSGQESEPAEADSDLQPVGLAGQATETAGDIDSAKDTEKKAAAADAIQDSPDVNFVYSIQLAAFQDQEGRDQFVADRLDNASQLLGQDLLFFKDQRDSETWWLVTLGKYQFVGDTTEDIARLEQELGFSDTWVRPVAGLVLLQ